MTETEKLLAEINAKLARLEELAEQSDGKISSLFEYRNQDRRDLDEVRVGYVQREAFDDALTDLRTVVAAHQSQLSELRAAMQKYVGMGVGAVALVQIVGQFIGSIE